MNNQYSEIKEIKKKIFLRFALLPLFIGLVILLPAGTFRYWQAYTYMLSLIGPVIWVLRYFLIHNPEFLLRRSKMKEKEATQKLIVSLGSIVYLAIFIIPGLDKRYSWTYVPVPLVLTADFLIILSYIFIFFVFKENSYASRVIEVKEDQKVISTGPYSIIRHPMYLGVFIMFLATPVALGSYMGLIPFTGIPVMLFFRILNEEKVLKRELKGYEEYCRKVKYRLIPHIW